MTAREQTPIVFTVVVSQRDWDTGLGGWRCPALRIPSAEVDDVFVDGSSQDKSWYVVRREHQMIRWVHGPRPEEATISIKLTEELSTQKRTRFWQMVSALAPIVAALVTVVLSYFLLGPPTNSQEHIVFNLSSPVYGECGRVTINGFVEMSTGSRRKISRLLWDWGDGSSVDSFLPVTHRYLRDEKYSVKVIAYASDNENEGHTILINITNASQPNCP